MHAMSKETKYLFSMESVEDGIEHTITVEEKSESTAKDTIYHFRASEGEKSNGKQNYKKWMKNNVMLISTLGAVIVGVAAGE